MIETHKVAKTHGSTTVLHGVSVQIPVGQFTAIIGPNGAGKSTLLSMVSRLDAITSGSAHVAGPAVFMPEIPPAFCRPSSTRRPEMWL